MDHDGYIDLVTIVGNENLGYFLRVQFSDPPNQKG